MVRLSQVAAEIYKMTSTLSRSTRSISKASLNCDTEVYTTKNIVLNSHAKVKQLLWELDNAPWNTYDCRNRRIHNRNLKYGGYFAFSPLDRVFY